MSVPLGQKAGEQECWVPGAKATRVPTITLVHVPHTGWLTKVA